MMTKTRIFNYYICMISVPLLSTAAEYLNDHADILKEIIIL